MATITIPLTTVFTPPASCHTLWTYEGSYYNSIANGLLIQNALDVDEACFPTGFGAAGRAAAVTQVYSPGACPNGYQTAGNTFNGLTTTAICCPSQFSYTVTFSEIEHFSSSAEFHGCVSMFVDTANPTFVPARSANQDLSSTYVTGPVTMWAQPVTVAFRQVDTSLFTTMSSSVAAAVATPAPTSSFSSATSTPAPTALSSTATTSTPPSTAPSPDQATSASLTSTASRTSSTSGDAVSSITPAPASFPVSAIAGIAIGAAAVLGIILAIAIVYRRRKARPGHPQSQLYHPGPGNQPGELPPVGNTPAELEGKSRPFWKGSSELPWKEKAGRQSQLVEMG